MKLFVRLLTIIPIMVVVVFGVFYIGANLYFDSKIVPVELVSFNSEKIKLVNPLVFKWWLFRLGYKSGGVAMMIKDITESYDVRSILVQFTDENQESGIVKSKDGIIASSNFNYDSQSKKMKILLQTKRTGKQDDATYSSFIEYELLDNLYKHKTGNNNDFKEAKSAWKDIFFKYKDRGLRFLQFQQWRILGLQIIKPAYAGCTGTFQCGYDDWNCNGDWGYCSGWGFCTDSTGTPGSCSLDCHLNTTEDCRNFTDCASAPMVCGDIGACRSGSCGSCSDSYTCPTSCGYSGGWVNDGCGVPHWCSATSPCCVPDCSGKSCGSDGCSGSCGTCGGGTSCVGSQCCTNAGTCPTYPPTSCYPGGTVPNGTCGTTVCAATCCPADPGAPTQNLPTNGFVFTTNPTIDFTWSAPNWGEGCPNNTSYRLCVNFTADGSNSGTCNMLDKSISSAITNDNTFVPTREGVHWWNISAINNGRVTWAGWRSFTAKVAPNCTGVTGLTEIPINVANNFSANFSSPVGNLSGNIFRTDLTAGNSIISSALAGAAGTSIPLTGSWTPTAAEKGNRTVYCRAAVNGFVSPTAVCQPSGFSTSPWPLNLCAGPNTSFGTCVEAFTGPVDANAGNSYVTGWSASTWSTCNASHVRTRTRICNEDCASLTDNCAAYLTPANCPAGSTCSYNPATKTQTETQDCIGTIQGNLYDASDCASGCSCGTSTSIGSTFFKVTGAFASSISPNPNTAMAVDASGHYTFNAFLTDGANVFTFDFENLKTNNLIGDAVPKAFCPDATPTLLGCDTSYVGAQPCQPNPAKVFDFGFFRKFGGWWQVTGGNIHAEDNIASLIPASVDALTDQRIIKTDANGRDGLVSYGGTMNYGNNPNVFNAGSYTISGSNYQFKENYKGLNYNYAFFNAKLKPYTYTDWTTGNDIPAYSDAGNGYMLVRYVSNDDLNINNPITVGAGDKYIILVPQKVNINSNITVFPGGFLAIIASGDITFGSTMNIAQGWYLSNGVINIQSTGNENTELKFVGSGSFVGLNGFSLNRNRGFLNNKSAAEEFIYREDILTNSPMILRFPYKYYAPYNP